MGIEPTKIWRSSTSVKILGVSDNWHARTSVLKQKTNYCRLDSNNDKRNILPARPLQILEEYTPYLGILSGPRDWVTHRDTSLRGA